MHRAQGSACDLPTLQAVAMYSLPAISCLCAEHHKSASTVLGNSALPRVRFCQAGLEASLLSTQRPSATAVLGNSAPAWRPACQRGL